MRKLVLAAVAAASLASAPIASADGPPTDPVKIGGGTQGCQPDYPCTFQPITVTPDKTYPSRLAAWVTDQVT